MQNCVCLERHALRVRVLSYENERNQLFQNGQYVCCDGPSNSDFCSPCDTYFQYCLRLRNLNQMFSFECPDNGRTLVSQVNRNDGPLDFSMSTVLGLPNPFVLSGFEDPEVSMHDINHSSACTIVLIFKECNISIHTLLVLHNW